MDRSPLVRTKSSTGSGPTMTPIDVPLARTLTPGCAHVLHFNNAGASLMPEPVIAAVKEQLDLEARMGGYEAAFAIQDRIERMYTALAELLHCAKEEVCFAESATRAWDMALLSLRLGPGDRVLTGYAEYGGNWLALLKLQRSTGCTVELVPDDASGQIDVVALKRMLDERVKLVALTHVPSSGGLVNPIESVGAALRGSNAIYLVDACQSAGQLPLDVERIGCDLLSGTGRKYLRGPRGTGFLYVRCALLDRLEPPFLDAYSARWTGMGTFTWRPDARRFEGFESSVANKLGFGAAVEHALGWGLDAIADRNTTLANRLREGLGRIPRVVVRDQGELRSAIVTFTADVPSLEGIRIALHDRRMNISLVSLELARLDLEPRGITGMVRASVHYYNTEEEVDRFVSAVSEALR